MTHNCRNHKNKDTSFHDAKSVYYVKQPRLRKNKRALRYVVTTGTCPGGHEQLCWSRANNYYIDYVPETDECHECSRST